MRQSRPAPASVRPKRIPSNYRRMPGGSPTDAALITSGWQRTGSAPDGPPDPALDDRDAFLGPILVDVDPCLGPFRPGPALNRLDAAAGHRLDIHAIFGVRTRSGSRHDTGRRAI